MLSQVIAHSCNIGYEMNKNLHLKSFNNIKIKNLKHLKQLIDEFERKKNTKNTKKTIKRTKSSKLIEIDKKDNSNSDSNSTIVDNSNNEESAMVFEFTNGQIVVLDGKEAIEAKDQVIILFYLILCQ